MERNPVVLIDDRDDVVLSHKGPDTNGCTICLYHFITENGVKVKGLESVHIDYTIWVSYRPQDRRFLSSFSPKIEVSKTSCLSVCSSSYLTSNSCLSDISGVTPIITFLSTPYKEVSTLKPFLTFSLRWVPLFVLECSFFNFFDKRSLYGVPFGCDPPDNWSCFGPYV